ncbi:MAG TPA: efflux RND transporter periplasmic adaptor subunit [Gemmatimonadales bacterium]|jgi:RND family efflux transporter MFP subunit
MRHILSRSLVLIALLPLVGCGKKTPTDGADGPLTAATDSSKGASTLALPVVGEPVRKGDLILTVNATGQVRTDATSMLKSEAQGTVIAVTVRPGDRVTAGQALVTIDPKPLDLDVQSAQAALDAGLFGYNSDVYADSVTEGKVREARRSFARASHNIDGLEVSLQKAKMARDHATITAPFDGTIESVAVAVGDRISVGADIATVVDMKHLRVEAQVLEHDLPLLRVGGEAVVTVAAIPDRPVRGVIAAVLPLVDSVTRAGRAIIRITGDGTLRPGMYADVRLETNRLADRILIPTQALVERDGRPLVFVAKDGRAEWVYVLTGRSNGRETEVLPDSSTGVIPLHPGDMVLTEGQRTLTHQAPIHLTPRRDVAAH